MHDAFDYFGWVVGLALAIFCAVFFYRVGELEYEKGYLTALASLTISLIACFWFNAGSSGVMVGQGLLFGILWIYNLRRKVR